MPIAGVTVATFPLRDTVALPHGVPLAAMVRSSTPWMFVPENVTVCEGDVADAKRSDEGAKANP